jgi:asparagine synthase (glutamine-hydrolysing)
MLYILAAQRGHRVVLDGIDGDGVAAITSTYPAYLLRAGKLITAQKEIRGMCLNYHSGGIPVSEKLQQMVRLAWTPGFVRSMKRKLSRENPTWQDRPNFIDPEFAKKVQLHERIMNSNAEVATGRCDSLREAHARRITAPYVAAGLERYGRLAASCGVEQREPYQDLKVVEFCLSLPWQQLVRNGWSKFGLRRVAERVLPKEAAWRPGRESIMWKFWVEWYRLRPVATEAILPVVDEQLGQAINSKEFEIALNQYRMSEAEVVASVQKTASLATWLSSTLENAS